MTLNKYDRQEFIDYFSIQTEWSWLWWSYNILATAVLPDKDLLTRSDSENILNEEKVLDILKIALNQIIPNEVKQNKELVNISGDENNGVILRVEATYVSRQEIEEDRNDSESKATNENNENETLISIPFTYQITSIFKEFRGSSSIVYTPKIEVIGEISPEDETKIREFFSRPDAINIFDAKNESKISITSLELNLTKFKPAFLSASFGFAPRAFEGVKILLGELVGELNSSSYSYSQIDSKTNLSSTVANQIPNAKTLAISLWADRVTDRNYLPFEDVWDGVFGVLRAV